MTAPSVKVLASRDFRLYRAVSSPVAAIATRYFAFMSSESPAASHARYAYATAYLGHEPSAKDPFVGSQLDNAVRQMLAHPPTIVLAQGPMHPWGLFTPESELERQSLRSGFSSSTSGSTEVVEPVNAIFLPWQVHQALSDALESGDEDDKSSASFFLLAGVVHETAHWIAANRHGYKHDPDREAKKTSLLSKLNFGMAKIKQHSRRDWGTHAKELLLGFAYTYVSYADGSHEVVCQKVQPVLPKLKPALSPEHQAYFTGCDLPGIIDISKFGAPALREVPKWRPKSDFLIVSSISPDVSCHHGACRLRDSH